MLPINLLRMCVTGAVLVREVSEEQKEADREAVLGCPNFAIILDFIEVSSTANCTAAVAIIFVNNSSLRMAGCVSFLS